MLRDVPVAIEGTSASEDVAEEQLRAFSRGLQESLEEEAEDLPVGVRRAMKEARRDAEKLNTYLEWRALHPERAEDFAEADVSTTKRQLEFEDDGTVNSLLVAFMRDVRIRAQVLDRPVPPGMKSKVVRIMRHGQGFHNMLEAQKGMEGVVSPKTFELQGDDGFVWCVAPAFDEIFTEKAGARRVLGVILKNAWESLMAYSDDNCETWNDLPSIRNDSAEGPCRVTFKGKVKCTHLRVRALGPASGQVTVQLLVPTLARAELLDPALTALGRQQALDAHGDVLAHDVNPQLVVVSPLARATETAMIVFKHLLDENGIPRRNVRFVAHEGLHERAGSSTCDCRRPLSQLKQKFPYVDYSLLTSEEDPLWSADRESQASMIIRLYEFLLWLRDCPEKEVGIAAHCSVNFTLLNAVVDCGVDPDLAKWFCTAEVRSLRLLWEEAHKEEARFSDSASHIKGLTEGMCWMYPHVVQVAKEGDEDAVVLRRDFEAHAAKGRVSIVCGGGAGHEPMMSGYVGAGLLTASVTGALFASPSPGAILRAITMSAGHAGCLLLVKNYPGLRFNHSVAAQRARRLGLRIELVLISDDVGSIAKGNDDARGLVGAVLALKAAGACAERGDCLEAVAAAARSVAEQVRTMAAALRWQGSSWSLELGVGIHGEPGAKEVSSLMHLPGASANGAASAIAQVILRQVLPLIHLQAERRVLLALNNLGGTSPLEMAVLCNAACGQLASKGIQVVALVQGTLMTSLDMHGVSLSVLPVDGDLLQLLSAPAQRGSAWPGFVEPCDPADSKVDVKIPATSEGPHPPEALPPCCTAQTAVSPIRLAVEAACKVLMAEATVTALNEMDRACGDADCGVTHRDAAVALLTALDELPQEPISEALFFLARSIERECRGAIGGIYVLGLEAAGQCLKERGESQLGPADWAHALYAAVESISLHGGARVGDRTLLDALAPAAEAFRQQVGADIPAALRAAVAAAKQGAKDTQRLVARSGRARHVPRWRQARCADPGAVGFAKWLEAIERASRGA